MNDDTVLLRRYADEGVEDAFTELVSRHVDLVFGAALRRTGGDAHLAADVAQQVFITLARDARKLSRHTVLAAWLHTATRNAALNLMISEQRRRIRENTALALDAHLPVPEPLPEWERVRPVLDAAIDELPEPDRAAIALRFLQRRPFSAIGAALKVSEDAARMRTERALDKLRVALARRGITSSAAALGTIVGSQSAFPAPVGLGALLASKSLAAVSTSAGGGLVLFSSLMNTPTLVTAAATALIAFGAGTYFGFSQNVETPLPPIETPRHSQVIASLRQDNLSLKAEVARLNADVSRLNSATQRVVQRSAANPSTPSMAAINVSSIHKATLNNLRQIAAAREQFQLEYGRPPTSVDELVGETKYIRRLVPVDGENYTGLSMLPNQPLIVVTASGLTITYDPKGNTSTIPEPGPAWLGATANIPERVKELGRRIERAGIKATEAYRAANNGQHPPSGEALIPYFATPQEGADFVEFLEAHKAARSN
jgi:RNA polymerase sigma factor (sigma-70 family)